ncbi:alpha/beta fold hydrolase [Alkalibacter saccharofermentans]|uniref:Pimeloyl-ACP methyl ester carboxylesterase n=1 Tax=Alkalibacter saccharofermentans DSM 14828 TaxID=1120975 RepID=A0A1M4WCN9_9FIRM|nr:alpha/beta hydrolase [Alkalibacter saccharofermentans]SHE79009.1 Pimeloyl-ACP methyl ester carboxylesterase [Alkalibacter saccharofermentans DSM 14828]
MYYENKLGKIYYEVHGPENAPAIVFNHGVTMDHRTFKEQIEALKDKYRVIIWDMPYHGKSSAIDDRLHLSATAADFLMELLDDLKIDKAILVGLSFGSFVSQHAASKHPARVVAMIQISGQSLYPKRSAFLNILKPFFVIATKIQSEKRLAKSFAKHKTITPHTLVYLEEGVYHIGKKTLGHLFKEMIRDWVTGIPELLKQPMLIIYGDREFGAVKKMHQRWHANTPNSEIVMIKNAHHITNQDNPEEVNKAILSFITNLRHI